MDAAYTKADMNTKKSDLGTKLAKVIRVIFIPPVMVAILIFLLRGSDAGVITTPVEFWLSLGMLSILPVLAYPASLILPRGEKSARDSQRTIAFAFSGAGYVLCWVLGNILRVNDFLQTIYTIYLSSFLLLLLLNGVFHLKASGHACSITGPLLIFAYLFGVIGVLTALAVYASIFWASIKLGRHRPKELLLGSMTSVLPCIAAFILM